MYKSLKGWTSLMMWIHNSRFVATSVGVYAEPTQHPRDEVHHSQELERMHMEENQPEAAKTCGGMGTDETTLVGPSSLAVAVDRLPVHLNSSFGTACLGDPQATSKSSNVPVKELERMVNYSAPKTKEAATCEFEAWPNW